MTRVTSSVAARVLGVSPANLRRWVREGKFDHIDGMEWERRPGFQKQRLYSIDWLRKVAETIGVDNPDFSVIEGYRE